MEKNNNYGKCSIADCSRPATVRNFSCLYGNWEIKPELQNDFENGKTLKICAAHYNEDLRLHPRDKSKPKTRVQKVHHHRRSNSIQAKVIKDDQLKPQVTSPKHTIYPKTKRRGSVCHKFIPNVTLTFNISNEPCLKYSLGVVADRSHDRQHWTSFRLKSQVMFIETEYSRYELSAQGTKQNKDNQEIFYCYRWAKVNDPIPLDRSALNKINIPLDDSHITTIFHSLKWNEIQWGPKSVSIRNQEFPLRRILFASIHAANQTASSSPNPSLVLPQTTSNAPANMEIDKKSIKINQENTSIEEKQQEKENVPMITIQEKHSSKPSNSSPSSSSSSLSSSSSSSSSPPGSSSSPSQSSPSISNSNTSLPTSSPSVVTGNTNPIPEKWSLSANRCGGMLDSRPLPTANKQHLRSHEHS